MDEKKPAQLGAGNVEIELDGHTVVLKPSLRAMQVISRQKGGIVDAINAVGNYDFDTIVQVITIGLNVSSKDARDLPEKIFKSGLNELAGPVIRYLSILANGGRPPPEEEESNDDEDNDSGNPSSV